MEPISGVQAIVFDAGGTLLAPYPSVGAVYAEILTRHGVALAPATIEQRFRRAFAELRAHPRSVINETTEREFWREIVNRCITPECPPSEIDSVFADLYAAFASASRWSPLPGASDLLSALAQPGRPPLAILSNWDARLHRVLAELNWTRYFRHVFISSEIGFEKPDRRAFQAAEAALAVPAHSILHVGDSLDYDYLAARQAGWQSILIAPLPRRPDTKSPTLPSLTDLLHLLQ